MRPVFTLQLVAGMLSPLLLDSRQASGPCHPLNESGCEGQSPWEKQGRQSRVMETAYHGLEETALEKNQTSSAIFLCKPFLSRELLPKRPAGCGCKTMLGTGLSCGTAVGPCLHNQYIPASPLTVPCSSAPGDLSAPLSKASWPLGILLTQAAWASVPLDSDSQN